MLFFQRLLGLTIVLFSLNTQAGVFDFFCLQEDAACSNKEPVAQQKQVLVQPTSNSGIISPIGQTAPCVDVKGSASMEGVDKAFARKMAIRDALKMASMTNNVNVRTDQSVEEYQLTLDSARFTSNSKVKSYTVVSEGLEDPEDMYGQTKQGAPNYEVSLNVCLTEEEGICTGLDGHPYQTRLVVAPIVMPHASEARDISNLLLGYQLELERRIKNRGYRNLTVMQESIDLQPNIAVTPNLDLNLLSDIRNKTGGQYLLLTVIRSLSAHPDNGFLNDAKRFYNLEVKPDSRYIEVDWYLVDLMKNSTVHQARGGFDVKGDVVVGRNKPFGTNAFFSTDTGMSFHALLESQTKNVLSFLHCKPFESQVIDIQNGNYVIYLHEESGAKVGDDLAVYHTAGRPVRFNGQLLGQDQVPGAFLKIKRILPRFAIAELTAKKGVVQIGDVVKTW